MSSLLLPLVLLAVPALAVAIFFASAGLLPIDERKLDGGNGRRSISFGLISILFLLGGFAEWGISAYLTQLTVAYPLEFWRWFTRVVEFAVAAGVFCGMVRMHSVHGGVFPSAVDHSRQSRDTV